LSFGLACSNVIARVVVAPSLTTGCGCGLGVWGTITSQGKFFIPGFVLK